MHVAQVLDLTDGSFYHVLTCVWCEWALFLVYWHHDAVSDDGVLFGLRVQLTSLNRIGSHQT